MSHLDHDIRSDGRSVWIDLDTGFTVARFGMLGVDVHTPDTTACLDCTHGPTGPAEWDRFVASVHHHYGIVVPDKHRPRHCRPTPCLGCGHARRNHIGGVGLCLVKSCRLCLIYRPASTPEVPDEPAAPHPG
jgi:hypothetical protein